MTTYVNDLSQKIRCIVQFIAKRGGSIDLNFLVVPGVILFRPKTRSLSCPINFSPDTSIDLISIAGGTATKSAHHNFSPHTLQYECRSGFIDYQRKFHFIDA